MKSFNELASKLKTILNEDLSPEEIEQLQKVSDQTNDRSKKVRETLESNGWHVGPGLLAKERVDIQARKDDYLYAYISVPTDSSEIKVNIELKKDMLKDIDVNDLKEIVTDLEDIIEALR